MYKKFFLLFLTMFIGNFSLNAQIMDATSETISDNQNFKFYQIENYKLPLNTAYSFADLNLNVNPNKNVFFEKHNSLTSLNDVYINTNDGEFTYVTSSFSLENLHRGVKIDSYNPLGMSPDGKSLIFGVFGVVLDKLQN